MWSIILHGHSLMEDSVTCSEYVVLKSISHPGYEEIDESIPEDFRSPNFTTFPNAVRSYQFQS